MRVVVCDTGPVLHLSEADALGLLEKTGEVVVTPAVEQELSAHAVWIVLMRVGPGAIVTNALARAYCRRAGLGAGFRYG